MTADSRAAGLDPHAASDAKLTEIRDFCGKLKWLANLLEKTWTRPASSVTVESSAEGETVLALPNVVQESLETYRPHAEQLRSRWEHPYPIADYERYPTTLRSWLVHLLKEVELHLALSPDNESDAVKTSACIVNVAKKLGFAASDPNAAMLSKQVKEFERKKTSALWARLDREQREWPRIVRPIPYGAYVTNKAETSAASPDPAAPTDVITIAEIAQLATVELKTVHNKLSAARKDDPPPSPKVESSGSSPARYSYAEIRPWLVKNWQSRANCFPKSFEEVRKKLL